MAATWLAGKSKTKEFLFKSLEEAAKNIFNQEFEIQGSGRTDAGVHALGQVAHINLQKIIN